MAAAPIARIGVGDFAQVEQEAVGRVAHLLSQLPVVALNSLDERDHGRLGFEGEVEGGKSHR